MISSPFRSHSKTLLIDYPDFLPERFSLLEVEGHLIQMELSGFGNKKTVKMKNTLEEENVDVIYCHCRGFKGNKNLLVFKIEM